MADVTDWMAPPAGHWFIPFILLVSVCTNLGKFRGKKETWVIFKALCSSCPILQLMCFDKHILSSLSEFSPPPHGPDNDVQKTETPWKWPLPPRLHCRGTAVSSVPLIARLVYAAAMCISSDCCLENVSSCYYTEWLLYRVATIQDGYYRDWLLCRVATIQTGYYTEWLLYKLATIQSGYYTEWLLYRVTHKPLDTQYFFRRLLNIR